MTPTARGNRGFRTRGTGPRLIRPKWTEDMSDLRDAAMSSKAWPFEEARKLVRRYESRIYNYGLRLTGNASDAMDLTQDVFLGVFRNLQGRV